MSYNFYLFFNFFSQKHFFENFKWAIVHIDFVGFLFKTSKLKNNMSYMKYKISHRFGKVCRWLNIYYSKIIIIIFFKTTIVSIWIILRNLVWTHKNYNFYHFWAIQLCIHPIINEGIEKINAFKFEWTTSTHFWNDFAIPFLDR